MCASKTTRNLRWLALAAAVLHFHGQAFAGEVPEASPAKLELSKWGHVEVESGAKVDRLPPIVVPGSGNAHQMRLREGTIHINVDAPKSSDLDIRVVGDKLVELPAADANRAVLVRAPRGQVVIVDHGRATLTVDQGHLRVTNWHGKTLAGTAQAVSPLGEGQARVEGCPGPSLRSVPAAPTFPRGDRIWVAVGAEKALPQTFAWTASPGAVRYHVRVDRQDQAREPLFFSLQGTTLGEGAPLLLPGRYAVRVRAVDACGIESPQTPAETIHVVGLGLPHGSYQDDEGTIRTEVGARIRLTHVQNVQLSYPNVARGVDAPREISLRRNAEQDFLLSSSGATPTLLRLAPRNIQASVRLGPHNVRWPGPSVEVSVTLEASDGEDVPSWLEPIMNVTVGAKQVHLEWRRDGNTMRGVIPPQPELLPCVVRVEVTDQFGLPLGRDFLEVARAPS